MSWINERTGREWKVGDTYWIYEDGHRLTGRIVDKCGGEGFYVEWDDESLTFEGPPTPAREWREEKEEL
jgi:hypothetical protein